MYELRTFNSVLQSVTVGGYYSRHENTRTMFEICSKLERTVEELYRRSGNFILDFEQNSPIVLVFPVLL